MKKQNSNKKINNYGTIIYDFMDEKWKKEKTSFRSVLILFIIILCLVVLFNVMRGFIFTRIIDIEIVEKENVKFSQEYKGLIIRDEEVRYASDSGSVYKMAKEGERVAKAQPVVSYEDHETKQDSYEDIEDRKQKLKEKLEAKFQEVDSKLSGPRRNLEVIDEINRDIKEVFAIKNSLDEIQGKDENLEEILKGENVVKSQVPGIVSYIYDGYENILTPDRIGELSINEIKGFISGEIEELHLLEDEQLVVRGQSLFKIVDNYSWIISIIMESNEMEELIENFTQVKFSLAVEDEDELYSAEIKDYIMDEGEGVLFLEVNRDIHDFWKEREIKLSVTLEEREGINVPSRALVEKDGDKGVYIVKRGIVRFKPLEISFRKDNNIYTSELEEGDKLITNPRFIQDGDIVR